MMSDAPIHVEGDVHTKPAKAEHVDGVKTVDADARVAYLTANPGELRKFVEAAQQNADDFIALNRAYAELRDGVNPPDGGKPE
jgi:hypothetical protein